MSVEHIPSPHTEAAGNGSVIPLEVGKCPREGAVTESGLFSKGSSQAVLSAHQLSPYPGRQEPHCTLTPHAAQTCAEHIGAKLMMEAKAHGLQICAFASSGLSRPHPNTNQNHSLDPNVKSKPIQPM